MPSYVKPQHLHNEIISNNKGFVVIDVRDEDYVGGHIINSVNMPSDTFSSARLYEDILEYDRVYFHCMYSQVRGPKCASLYSKYLEENKVEQTVYVLEGGYVGFKNLYPKLIK